MIVEDEDSLNFLQCKYMKGRISKRQLDWILYKASKKLYEEYHSKEKKLKFTLVINSLETNFSQVKPKKMKLNFSNVENVKYPWLQYFLDHNHIQNKVKLQVEEIEMKR